MGTGFLKTKKDTMNSRILRESTSVGGYPVNMLVKVLTNSKTIPRMISLFDTGVYPLIRQNASL